MARRAALRAGHRVPAATAPAGAGTTSGRGRRSASSSAQVERGRRRQRPDHQRRAARQAGSRGTHQVPQPALHPVADHRAADGPGDDETDPRGVGGVERLQRVGPARGRSPSARDREVHHQRRPAGAHPLRRARENSWPRVRRCVAGSTVRRQASGSAGAPGSGRQLGAALAAARREDRAAGTGAHAQAEAVGLGPTAVVRLEGALAHDDSGASRDGCTACADARLRRRCRRGRTPPDARAGPSRWTGAWACDSGRDRPDSTVRPARSSGSNRPPRARAERAEPPSVAPAVGPGPVATRRAGRARVRRAPSGRLS